MDHAHNHGHWFVFGALFSVVCFGGLSMMEINARHAQTVSENVEYTPNEPLLIVIPLLMFLVLSLAVYKWWHERN